MRFLFICVALAAVSLGCGDGASDCSKSSIADKTVTINGAGSISFSKDCSYIAPTCNESGSWSIVDDNRIKVKPSTTTCGSTNEVTCTYVIVNDQIALTCS